jgi:two-component system cell cycle response regulator
MYQSINLDGLTQIANRHRFNQYLTTQWQRHQEEQTHLALIMIDIDYFKPYNDYYGHLQGDDCLIQVAGALSRTSATWCAQIPQRAGDLVARFGGEEFAAILPNTKSQDALIIAESMRNAISLLGIPHVKSEVSQYIAVAITIRTIYKSPNPPLTKGREARFSVLTYLSMAISPSVWELLVSYQGEKTA